MNRNTTALLLIVLAIGIYFTFTRGKVNQIRDIRATNLQYEEAIKNSNKIVEVRDSVRNEYNSISETNRERLNKLIPDNVDNVRLIIDVKDDIAARRGLLLKNIKTASPETATSRTNQPAIEGDVLPPSPEKYGTVGLSFTVSGTYENFISFLQDLEASLRIMDVSNLSIIANADGAYDFTVDIKTYWLKQ